MLYFNLKPIFKVRGIKNPYTFLVKAGISPNSATNLINSAPRAMRLDHVEKLCKLLFCEPNDLLLWVPDTNTVYTEDFPLHKLKKTGLENNNWQDTLAQMPLKELKEVAQAIVEKKSNTKT